MVFAAIIAGLTGPPVFSETFRLATWNLENYVDAATPARHAKRTESKNRIREAIRALKPDVIALEELGSLTALEELQEKLRAEGLALPYREYVAGRDTNAHVAVLSRFPIVARRSRTNEMYLLSGRRLSVSRGLLEVDLQVNEKYVFTLMAAHLKSKRVVAEADEAEMRLEEAKLLREHIDAALRANPQTNLAVVGDFNDTQDAPPLRTLIGKGRGKLVDTRPAERNGDHHAGPGPELRTITWTHYFGKADTFSRLDYILLSPGMAREWQAEETFILAQPDWGVASDHRPIVATVETEDR